MNPQRLSAFLAIAAIACTQPAADATDATAAPTLSRIEAEAAGGSCASGGRAVQSGPDANLDGVLAADEITATEYLCAAAPPRALLRRDPEPPGRRCRAGGLALRVGVDDDGDGFLADDEIDHTDYACSTAAAAALTRVDDEPAGATCPLGGLRVHAGLDADGDGALDDVEITRTITVCRDAGAAPLQRIDDAGAACAHGGVAVRVGPDRDADGALDDDEVTQVEHVCSPAPADVLLRSDAEPAGAHCPHGGIAVRAGADGDRDHTLDDDEIAVTTYVCAPAPVNVLVRRDAEPAGAGCTDGGVAIRSGLDRDLDGTLDDAEVEVTTLVCDVVDLIEGDVVVDDATTDQELARLADLRVITGALSIQRNGRVAMPRLAQVGSGVVIAGGVHEVDLPALTAITGDLRVGGTELDRLELPALARIGGTLAVEETALPTLVAPALVHVGDDVMLTDTALDAPQLATIHGGLWLRGLLGPMALPALRTVGGELGVDAAIPSLALPALTQVAVLRLAPTLLEQLALPSLTRIAGLKIRSRALRAVSAPVLAQIDGVLSVQDCPVLAQLDLPQLAGIQTDLLVSRVPLLEELVLGELRNTGGGVAVTGVPALTRLELPRLERILNPSASAGLLVETSGLRTLALPALIEVWGNIFLDSNPELERIDLTALSLADRLIVHENPRLTVFSAPALLSVATRLSFMSTPALTDVQLPSLYNVEEGLTVWGTGLGDLSGLDGLTTAGEVTITDNNRLVTANLRRLRSVRTLHVDSNRALTGLGFERLATVSEVVTIHRNDVLTSLRSFDRLRLVQGVLDISLNPQLRDLRGLEALQMVGGTLQIYSNPGLTSLDGLGALRAVGEHLTIASNPRLPASEVTRLRAQVGR